MRCTRKGSWGVLAAIAAAGCTLPDAPGVRYRDGAPELVDVTTDASMNASDAGRDAADDVVRDARRDADEPTDVAQGEDATALDGASDATDASEVAVIDAGATCAAPRELCGGRCVDTMSDNAHCGRCDNACGAPETCLGGSCGCPGGARTCGGACVDLSINRDHCGRCDNACPAAQSCVDGACTCLSGGALCGVTCATLNTDANHCGRCGNACGAGIPCAAGACVCPSAQTWCAGRCVNLTSDSSNCGACGNACGGSSCVASTCRTTLMCAANTADCNGNAGDGCEVNTLTSVQHCGRCGNACSAGQRCDAGICAPARNCNEIHTLWSALPSAQYMIRPAATTRAVWCDMDTAGGGWTVIYVYPGQTRPAGGLTYTVDDLAIPGAASEALIAYRNGSYGIADPAWARFPMPTSWRMQSPFQARYTDAMVMVTQATGAARSLTLRYGNAEFGSDCNSAWDPRSTGGRICINGSNAPFFCEWASSAYRDRCPNSTQRWDGAECSTSRRFSIGVR